MRQQFVLLSLLSASLLPAYAQTSPELDRAQQELERLRGLVAVGAAPRIKLEQAQFAIEDAKDDAVLRQTLFGSITAEQLTDEQAQAMVAAAERRVERQKQKIESFQKLVTLGVAARGESLPMQDELRMREQTLSLARTRANLLQELAQMIQAERHFEAEAAAAQVSRKIMERYTGNGVFRSTDLVKVEAAFAKTFAKPLPISAHGETALHKSLGFDHRGRVDVAVSPDAREGVWLRSFLEALHIPYYAFRSAIAGRATAPHIHIGPPSLRLQAAD